MSLSAMTPTTMESITTLASQYIHGWAKVEANRMAKTMPIIVPIPEGWVVGRYTIKGFNNDWYVYNSFKECTHVFHDKRAAVSWALLYQSGHFNQGNKILEKDSKVSKLDIDRVNYSYSRKQAVKKKNAFMIDVLDARLHETIGLLEIARNDLEKSLTTAKYNKGIWE